MTALQLKVHYKSTTAFRLKVDCAVSETGVTAIFGPSGSGKTTLLNCIAGLSSADPGSQISYRGEVWQSAEKFVQPWERGIGFVFQDARLFPHLSVQQNLDYAVKRQKRRSRIRAEDVIQWLSLEQMLHQSATALSAGQKQRVAIARALLSAPQLLLLDEPLANLDHAARRQCLHYLQKLRDIVDLPILYVSHDMEEVSQLADDLIMLNRGTVEAQGSVLDLCSRLDTSLSHSESSATIIVGSVKRHDQNYGLSELDVSGNTIFVNQMSESTGTNCRLRIAARDISVCRQRNTSSSILNILPVELVEIEKTNDTRVLLRLALGEQYLVARVTRKSVTELNLKVGEALYAQIKSVALLSEIMEPQN
ncbi:MAG: molybdate transport system ATP-binding protein [Halioglobus sp.]|jgi:molybdate transport system ATP-binding protein